MKHDDHGTAAVEFALVLPLFLLVALGTIEMGILIHRYAVIAAASREGARAGVVAAGPVAPSSSAIDRTVRLFLRQAGIADHAVNIRISGAGSPPGSDLLVQVEYPHRFVALTYLIPGVPRQLVLRSRTIMRHE